ncbi:energy transducer TonB [Variovorax sp. PCZ-1]|uniref:energy transducer TonB n=1 Tax=Variovorax sp. PCZ-1 TaxID=2835533 RepID=UPI001BCEAC37|nr:energy transducer TonB [Variovorax sp. PCZ-1]MBS7807736.1 energy transducer TonB [Variovorax sp. PCZ-1]
MSDSIPLHKRPVVIASAVALLHVGGLAALQSGLLVRAYEVIVPVEMISQIIEPPQPILPPPAPPAPPAPTPPEPAKLNKAVAPPPAPQPLAVADPTPAPNAPVATPAPPAPPAPLPPITAAVAATPTPAPPAAPSPPAAPTAPAPVAKVELPRSDADYLNNPRPPYPPVSKRLGEQGRVMLRVVVGADGSAQKVELHTSSGFDRLDAAAVAAVSRWRFKPGTRGGVPETMPFLVPLDFFANN